jgi:transcriptional regulator with XRE-family HTH domain
MSSNIRCYLRTLRREWGLTQRELASLLRKASRNRVSRVERGVIPPNAGEILAYSLIFGSSGKAIFRQFSEETDEAVMRGAYRLHQLLEGDNSIQAQRKRELVDYIRARAIKNANQKLEV